MSIYLKSNTDGALQIWEDNGENEDTLISKENYDDYDFNLKYNNLSGEMFLYDGETLVKYVDSNDNECDAMATGYSGKRDGLNNPLFQAINSYMRNNKEHSGCTPEGT
ncbi:hypothetical protein LLH00_15995 [bacterium]|nr:hypothetical protein [bacterium]